jgi:ubiquinone/menaquinone biosynthesis C-methylase UbiE
MADFFLKQARFDADRRYPPVARRVRELVGDDGAPVVMDLGCGPALLLPELAKALPRARLVGLDPSGDMLDLARRVLDEAGEGKIQLLEGRAEDIPMEDGSVDVVISLKNLHEWDDAPRGITEVARVLRPGGWLLLRDSNGGYPYWRLRLLVAWVRLTRGRLATHGYLGPYPDAYRPEQVDPMLEEAGLEVEEADRRSVDMFYLARRPLG